MHLYVQRAKQPGMPLPIELKVTGYEQGDFVAAMIPGLDGLQPPTGLAVVMHSGPLPELPGDFHLVEQGSITADMVTATRRTGKQILAWTINDYAAMIDLIRMDIDGLITDRVELATRLTSQ